MFKKLLLRLTKSVPEGHKYYSGIYHGGDAEYFYIPSVGNHIFDGEFSFRMKLGGGMYREAKGSFVNNRKEGPWQFTKKGRDSFRDLKVNFRNGEIEGNLHYTCEEETIGGIVMQGIDLTVDDGKIKGELLGVYAGAEFKGFCDEDGYPDGTWTMTSKNDGGSTSVEKEVWDHGTLMSSYEESNEWRNKLEVNNRFRERINYLLEEDVQHLLKIVGRGTQNTFLHIYKK